jgi:hypothetical protein
MNVRQTLMLVTLRIIWRTSFGLKWRGRLSPKSQGGAICFGTMKVARVVEQQWAGIQLFRFTFILHQESVPETLVCGTPRLRQRSSKEVGQIIRKVTLMLAASRKLARFIKGVMLLGFLNDSSDPNVSLCKLSGVIICALFGLTRDGIHRS